MERINRGEIWVVEPALHPKPRPGLIVSINPINDLCPDVLLIPLTRQPGPLRVLLPDQPEVTGLRTASYAKCEALGPVHKSRLKKKIGAIRPQDWPAIEASIKNVLGLET